jgi:stearoyl-CoA desaturase (delta-9 desaturase)
MLEGRVELAERPPLAASEPRADGPRAAFEVGSTADKLANILVITVPLILLGVFAAQVWNEVLDWRDLLILAITYWGYGAGITVGFHRLFTHRSFKTGPAVRVFFAILGSMALEGPVIEWVAYHRRHHTFSDQEGDPHSPHAGHGEGLRGALRGLFHAHCGWVMFSDEDAEEDRYARDLRADPLLRFVDRTFLVWGIVGMLIPFGLGVALHGTLAGGLRGLLWGGVVRLILLHHSTFSINSICHFFGRQRFATDDESRNVWWLVPFTFGESWHNNHHAFPTSARHGLGRFQLDPSMAIIRMFELVGLAHDVVRIPPERQATKLLEAR